MQLRNEIWANIANRDELPGAALKSEEKSGRRVGDRSSKLGSGDLAIPPAEWGMFANSFSRQHEGWLANISVNRGSQESAEISNCRLQRITIDRVGKQCVINISVTNGYGKQLIHSVPDPSHFTFMRDAKGAHEGLEIASTNGSVTHLRFRAAAHPEMLDGVLPGSDRLR